MDNDQHLRQRTFGRRVAARRQRLHLSQEDVATKAGVKQGAVGHWESGVRVPRWPELRRLAAALDVPAAWLIEPLTANNDGPDPELPPA